MAITTLSMVLTVFVLNLHYITDRPVPSWIKRLILVYLARLLCMCHYQPIFDNDRNIKHKARKISNRTSPNSVGKGMDNQIGFLANLNGTLEMNIQEQDTLVNCQLDSGYERHSLLQSTSSRDEQIGLHEDRWARDWRRLAEVVDRFFFWLFLSAIVITTLILFHPLTKSYFSILGDETILGDKVGDETIPGDKLRDI